MSKSQRNIEEAIESIREFYKAGRQSLEQYSDDEVYGKKVVEEEAKRLGWIPEMVRKARQLAREKGGYSEEELKELFATMREHAPDGRFGKTHVIRLLTVPKKHRASLQNKAIKGGWTSAQLRAEINRIFGARKHGGRHPSVLPNREGVYAQLEGMAEQWRRYGEALHRMSPRKKGNSSQAQDLDVKIQALLDTALRAIAELQKGLAEELAARHRGREGRFALRGDVAEGGK